jgi:hypothetical protein
MGFPNRLCRRRPIVHGILGRPGVDIGVADPRCPDPDQHITRAGLRNWDILPQLQHIEVAMPNQQDVSHHGW